MIGRLKHHYALDVVGIEKTSVGEGADISNEYDPLYLSVLCGFFGEQHQAAVPGDNSSDRFCSNRCHPWCGDPEKPAAGIYEDVSGVILCR